MRFLNRALVAASNLWLSTRVRPVRQSLNSGYRIAPADTTPGRSHLAAGAL
jgi:hypothetical protein